MDKFSDMPDRSKVWIYQSSRPFTSVEIEAILVQTNKFIENWKAHGETLKAAADVLYGRFIVLVTDESEVQASGCSIDTSVLFFKKLEKEMALSLFDRTQLTYRSGDVIQSCAMADFENKVASGEINADTIVFNNMVNTKADFESKWEVPLKNSWHKRYLSQNLDLLK